jgi:hypothetical protein
LRDALTAIRAGGYVAFRLPKGICGKAARFPRISGGPNAGGWYESVELCIIDVLIEWTVQL